MANSLLLTSFTTWKAEQVSNSSDDLLEILLQNDLIPTPHHLLRQIPVDFDLAPAQVIAQIEAVQPEIVVCCGMAEDRDSLSIEVQAVRQDAALSTTIDCTALLPGLHRTVLSWDAGNFVCNHLYYTVLHYLRTSALPRPLASMSRSRSSTPAASPANRANLAVRGTTHCIFIHVPILTPDNQDHIVSDFLTILHRLQSLVTC